VLAAAAEHIPSPEVEISAQQADSQSASEVQPPVVNWEPLARPTDLAPALLGARANALAATVRGGGGWDVQVRRRARLRRAIFWVCFVKDSYRYVMK